MVPWRNSVPRKRSALAPASFIDPCLPSRAERAPAADGWIHEIKHDGFRLQIHVRGSRVGLYTMTGVDWTERYPWIVEDMARLNVRHAIIDAECCCDGENGITDFDRLMARVSRCELLRLCVRSAGARRQRHATPPLADRKAALAKLLRKAKPGIRYSEHISGDGRNIFEHACKLGLEGIVSKRINAPYRSGKVKTWLKTKNPKAAAVLRMNSGRV